MARIQHGYLSRDELLDARERAVAHYGSAVACGSPKLAAKLKKRARRLGVRHDALDNAKRHAMRVGCKAAARIRRRVEKRLSA